MLHIIGFLKHIAHNISLAEIISRRIKSVTDAFGQKKKTDITREFSGEEERRRKQSE
jgi:hypothetical protein